MDFHTVFENNSSIKVSWRPLFSKKVTFPESC
ncbi:hypothetical protein MSKU3_0182 [Komagataeibacter oboediens]|nr:hypothetical protein MSKU3_0182 [Komagataeibacter oboediens]